MKMLPILIVSANIIFTIISVLICVWLSRGKNGIMKANYFAGIICFFSIVMLISGFVWLKNNDASNYGVTTDMMAFSILSCIIPFFAMIITTTIVAIVTGFAKHQFYAPFYLRDIRNSLKYRNTKTKKRRIKNAHS